MHDWSTVRCQPVAVAPQCSGDAFAGLDPLVRQYWYNRTPEGLPLWQHKPSAIVQELAGMVAGCIGLAALWRLPSALPVADRIGLTLLYLGTLLAAASVARAAIYPLCLAAVLTAPLIVRLFAESNGAAGVARWRGSPGHRCCGYRVEAIPGAVGSSRSPAAASQCSVR